MKLTGSLAIMLVAGLCGAASAIAATGTAQTASGHAVCIAPISVEKYHYVGPTERFVHPDDRFTLEFGSYRRVTVKVSEAKWVRGMPPDANFMLKIRRNGKPYAAFRLDMRKYRNADLCLVFNGYGVWQVIDKRRKWKMFGCKCP